MLITLIILGNDDYKSIYDHQFPKIKPEVHIYFTTVKFMPGAPNIFCFIVYLSDTEVFCWDKKSS